MTKAQRQFVSGGARPWLVIALAVTGIGGVGYGAHYLSADEASARSDLRNRYEDEAKEARNRYEDLMQKYVEAIQHCDERELDRGRAGGR